MNRVAFFLFLNFLANFHSMGQPYSIRKVNYGQPITIDSLPILCESVAVFNQNKRLFPSLDYEINCITNQIICHSNISIGTDLIIRYNKPLLDFKKPFYRYDPSIIQKEYIASTNPFQFQQPDELGTYDGLKINGNLMRGLSIGNNQNTVLNSNLNLTFSGKIQNDIQVVAAVSDESNPIQPEGNTQQLQDFDKVFIRFFKNNNQLVLGDYEMRTFDRNYFSTYFKKSRGMSVQSKLDLSNHNQLLVQANAAISRGRFVRNTFNGSEGNQGPYRLTGPNGEVFIVVISGTESVYLDGQKMQRGEQNDYTIDYNSGEISFMPKRIITQYSRIIVEFQYSDRNYARSVFTGALAYQLKNTQVSFSYYSEQDDKTQPFLQNLSDSDKIVMQQAGDDFSKTFVPAERVQHIFSSSKILYRKIDSLGYSGVFVKAVNANDDTMFYELNFSYVGEGNGNYIQSASLANGRVFSWIAPLNGKKQGSFEPIKQLITPNRLQFFETRIEQKIDSNHIVNLHIAQSQLNRNTFSEIYTKPQSGYGLFIDYIGKDNLGKSKNWMFKQRVKYEQVNASFRSIERYRSVEFDRIWNRLLTNTGKKDTGYDEKILSADIDILRANNFQFIYHYGWYNRNNVITGTQHQFTLNQFHKLGKLSAGSEFLQTQSNSLKLSSNDYYRLFATIEFNYFKWKLIGNSEMESSRFYNKIDSIETGSYRFVKYGASFSNVDTNNQRLLFSIQERMDEQSSLGEFKSVAQAWTFTSAYNVKQKKGGRLNIDLSYRKFLNKDTFLLHQNNEQTFLSRIEYDFSFWKRFILANANLQIGSGNEWKRDYQYLEVPQSQGQYVWKDLNNDGQQQLNEFFPASYNDRNLANYIRVYLPSNSLVRSQNSRFNQTIIVQTERWSNTSNGFLKFISRFYNQSAWQLDKKSYSTGDFKWNNPFWLNTEDSNLVGISSQLRNNLFFNRNSSIYGADYIYANSTQRNLQTNGTETRSKIEHIINLRLNAWRYWTLFINASITDKSYASAFFTSNNYTINSSEIKPKLSYQINNVWQLNMWYAQSKSKNDQALNIQQLSGNEWGIEAKGSIFANGLLLAKYAFLNLNFEGEKTGLSAYEMLQGLGVGRNDLLTISWQQRFNKNMQMQFTWDARQNNQNWIQTGRVEARYIF